MIFVTVTIVAIFTVLVIFTTRTPHQKLRDNVEKFNETGKP